MPRKTTPRHEIAFRPDHEKWLKEQVSGPRGISKVVEKCIDRVMRQTDAATRLELIQAEIVRIAKVTDENSGRLDTLAAFLDYQTWIATGRNDPAYEKWHEDFIKWRKESDNA